MCRQYEKSETGLSVVREALWVGVCVCVGVCVGGWGRLRRDHRLSIDSW